MLKYTLVLIFVAFALGQNANSQSQVAQLDGSYGQNQGNQAMTAHQQNQGNQAMGAYGQNQGGQAMGAYGQHQVGQAMGAFGQHQGGFGYPPPSPFMGAGLHQNQMIPDARRFLVGMITFLIFKFYIKNVFS